MNEKELEGWMVCMACSPYSGLKYMTDDHPAGKDHRRRMQNIVHSNWSAADCYEHYESEVRRRTNGNGTSRGGPYDVLEIRAEIKKVWSSDVPS